MAEGKELSVNEHLLDPSQAAAAQQFQRQSDRYGKSHILADTEDVGMALEGIDVPVGGAALDVATGGGHTALWLARHGWKVTAGDIAPRMLQNAARLCAEAGLSIETRLFPAEEMPFAAGSFELVTVRVAPHHFSSPVRFVGEVARVLKPGGRFLLIDGSVPDDDPETEEWLHRVEKLRDPSHGRYLSRKAWETLVRGAGLTVQHSRLEPFKQPDLQWYFKTAATPPGNRQEILTAVRRASEHVRTALRLGNEAGKIVWWWPRLTLLAAKRKFKQAKPKAART
jgi:ubiquinone/menaquinone biosynthesis C-methylase UbiE